jgi:hypothetical protein
MKKICVSTLVFGLLLLLTFAACNKENKAIEVKVAYLLIADKTWYLDYAQTTNGSIINTKTYLGQPTYFINYLKSLSTTDSDGLVGAYEIVINHSALQINVNAKTNSGNESAYTYEIESLGRKNMIMSYVKNDVKTRLFFSTK